MARGLITCDYPLRLSQPPRDQEPGDSLRPRLGTAFQVDDVAVRIGEPDRPHPAEGGDVTVPADVRRTPAPAALPREFDRGTGVPAGSGWQGRLKRPLVD